ncbi:MAG: penicillin-binding transpeptidase domain-containing protein [Spirochaetota bacterium]
MNQTVFNRRVLITGIIIVVLAAAFLYRLFNLHFSSKIILSPSNSVTIKRGYIKDTNGDILAMSIERNSVYANPSIISEPEKTADTLSSIVNVNRNWILKRLKRDKRFVWIKRKVDDATAKKIQSLNIQGVGFKKEFLRVYPNGNLAAQLLGFVGVDNHGLEGMEYKFDGLLTGDSERDRIVKPDKDIQQGYSVILTVDRLIQDTAERALAVGVERSGARRGVAVVMEVSTGRVLALAHSPTFNPEKFYTYPPWMLGNFSVVDSFEPGSTLKLFSMITILERKPDLLKSTYTCNGEIEIGEITINCISDHGRVSCEDIIAYSCNVGLVSAMKDIRKAHLYDTLHRFGFGSETGIEIPGESSGILRPYSGWSGLSKYSIAIGQEISVNSIQLAAAVSAIANRGVYMVPSVVEGIENERGQLIQRFYPQSRGRVVNEAVAARIMDMMKEVLRRGTGTRAAIPHYRVGGKTGTGQKSMKRGGYIPDTYSASFVGVAPLNDPDVCILILLDEPKLVTSGGQGAAPVFADIARRILPYRGNASRIKKAVDPGHAKKGAYWSRYTENQVPDFRGLSHYQALQLLVKLQKNRPVTYTLQGKGRVTAQKPSPGSSWKKQNSIQLQLSQE